MRDDDSDAEDLGQARVKRSTGKALLVETDDVGTFWVPVSVIHDDSEVYGSDASNSHGKLIVKSWWAKKEGIT